MAGSPVLFLLSIGFAVAQPPVGTLCVIPNSTERPARISPGGDYDPATLTFRIDKRQPIPWPHKRMVRIEDLSVADRHLIVLTSNGKRTPSFWFRFPSQEETKLCVYFDGYQGVDLQSGQSARWCKCK